MSLPNYLAKIKSSGIYRFVWDKSEVAGVPAETLRLVVGYSEKGPFNTPTYIQSASEFIQIYGNINKKLERRGVYFHRLALQALTTGPILALNLKKFNGETVDGISFAPNTRMFKGEISENGLIEFNTQKLSIENDIYDTNRFWVLDANKMQNSTENYISMSATDSIDCSNTIFVRGINVDGFDLSVKEWYSSATTDEMPSYFEGYENLKIEDFFAEVYVFRGKFSKEIASSKEMSKYLNVDENGNVSLKRYIENAFGEKVDALVALSQNENSNFLKRYQGILLPNFKDSQNNYISLDLLFNSDNYEHKMLMDFNIEMLENGDITVDTLVTTGFNNSGLTKELFDSLVANLGKDDYEKLTTNISIFNNYNIIPEISYVSYDGENWIYTNSDYVSAPHFYVYDINGEDLNSVDSKKFGKLAFQVGDRFLGENNTITTLVEIKEVVNKDAEISQEISTPELVKSENPKTIKFVYSIGEITVGEPVGIKGGFEMNVNDPLYGKKVAIKISGVNGKLALKDWTKKFVELTPASDGNIYFGAHGTGQFGFILDNTVIDLELQLIPNTKNQNINIEIFEVNEDVFAMPYNNDTIENHIVPQQSNVIINKSIEVTATNIKTKYVFDNSVNTFGGSYLVKYNSSMTADNSTLMPIYLEGYKLSESLIKPKSMKQWDKLQWQNSILSVLTDYPGIRTALTSRQDIEYRYIVDTFEGFVDSECKSKIAIIAKEKDNAMAFLNFPSVYNFTNCEYTSFTDEKNRFQVKYIKEGGNRLKNPSVLFSLVSEANGASYVSYNTPLTFTDGTVKTYVPSAALVSNNFMQKYTSRQPYYIVAGPNYGRMIFDGCVGPDYNYSRADLDILEPMGVNAMVYVPRKGTYINSNQTAKQNPVTALSKINVRELVIFLQDEIEALLQNYQWEFNTQALRDTVKAKADSICENVKANGGIYAFVNRCDSSNNTNDVIDNEMFVLSTEIEPSRGAGKMVQELTIHKTGGLTSTIK